MFTNFTSAVGAIFHLSPNPMSNYHIAEVRTYTKYMMMMMMMMSFHLLL